MGSDFGGEKNSETTAVRGAINGEKKAVTCLERKRSSTQASEMEGEACRRWPEWQESQKQGKNGSFSSHIHLSYVWIEESPNTASDCGVAPPKKGDGLRSRRGTTRRVEEHFPRHVQGLGWRKSSRNFTGKVVWRADGDKNPQKRYVQGSDGRTR